MVADPEERRTPGAVMLTKMTWKMLIVDGFRAYFITSCVNF